MANLISKLFENKYKPNDTFKKAREELMSEEEIERVDFYLDKFTESENKLSELLEEWEEIHKSYKGERTDIVSNMPENPIAVNILLSQIEGQVSSMMSNNITGSYQGVGYSDQKFARTASIVGDFILKQNHIKSLVKASSRRYLQFGEGILTTSWDEKAMNEFGLPKIQSLSPDVVFVDDKITDVTELQEADYIIHKVGSKSILWAKEKYGKERGNAIKIGNEQPNFDYEGLDDSESFTYLRVWTRNNEQGNLQLIEISVCGVLLSESEPFKPILCECFLINIHFS